MPLDACLFMHIYVFDIADIDNTRYSTIDTQGCFNVERFVAGREKKHDPQEDQ